MVLKRPHYFGFQTLIIKEAEGRLNNIFLFPLLLLLLGPQILLGLRHLDLERSTLKHEGTRETH